LAAEGRPRSRDQNAKFLLSIALQTCDDAGGRSTIELRPGVGWIVIGSMVGFIVSKMLDLHGDDPRLGIGVSAGGAIVAAAIYTLIRGAGVTPWNPWSMLFAAIGAGAGLGIWHGVRSRYVSRTPQTHRRSY
jgi:hypothetical protein